MHTSTKNDTSIVLPTIETIERSFHNCIISTFDILNMFYNIAVHKDSILFFNFYVENSIWSHGRLPQGWCGSPKISSEARRLDLSNAHLTPASQAECWKTKIKNSKKIYVFIIFIITKFGENFEDKIDICFF